MKIAKLIKDNLLDFRGYAALYELSEPIQYDSYRVNGEDNTSFVIVSTIRWCTFNETYIFPANKDG